MIAGIILLIVFGLLVLLAIAFVVGCLADSDESTDSWDGPDEE